MIELCEVAIRSGAFALSGLNLSVPAGACAVLMGRSGQGKTTILEALCGLRPLASGRVLLDGVDVTHFPPGDRNVGYVPQDLGLFPHLTVRRHLEFAPLVRGAREAEARARAEEVAALLGLEPLLDRGVGQLSGGEAQRVALGRALAFRPPVLLLDEPLSSLDEPTRDRLCDLIRTVQRSTGVTILYVTHTRAEAERLGDLHLELADGRLLVRG